MAWSETVFCREEGRREGCGTVPSFRPSRETAKFRFSFQFLVDTFSIFNFQFLVFVFFSFFVKTKSLGNVFFELLELFELLENSKFHCVFFFKKKKET